MPKLKLRPSVKSLQEAITCLNPVGPVCIQEAKTHSFREVEDFYSTFNHVFHTPTTSSSSSSTSRPYNPNKGPNQQQLEEQTALSRTTTISSTSPEPDTSNEADSVPKDLLSSHRFFFSPRTTKSIMEEVKAEMGHLKTAPSGGPAGGAAAFCEESVPMAMASSDPYRDFKTSMEEMVRAHEVREWPQLQELLHCYLRLNDKKTHSTILLAFVDVLMCLMAQDKDAFF